MAETREDLERKIAFAKAAGKSAKAAIARLANMLANAGKTRKPENLGRDEGAQA